MFCDGRKHFASRTNPSTIHKCTGIGLEACYWLFKFAVCTGIMRSCSYSDSTPTDYIHWGRYQPNNLRGRQDCVATYNRLGQWNDDYCSSKNAYICKVTISTFSLVTVHSSIGTDSPRPLCSNIDSLLWSEQWNICMVALSILPNTNWASWCMHHRTYLKDLYCSDWGSNTLCHFLLSILHPEPRPLPAGGMPTISKCRIVYRCRSMQMPLNSES